MASRPVVDEEAFRKSDPVPCLHPRKMMRSRSALNVPEIDISSISLIKEVESGTYATIYKARDTKTGTIFAVKLVKEKLDNAFKTKKSLFFYEQIHQFVRETRYIFCLPKCENIISFFGVIKGYQMGLVMEYCKKGDLCAYMRKFSEPVPYEKYILFLRNIISAVSALHGASPPIIHWDIKSPNVLISNSDVLKLGDFGASRCADNGPDLFTATWHYCPPEIIRHYIDKTGSVNVNSPTIDIYAFGVLMAEIVNSCVEGEYVRPFGLGEARKHSIYELIGHIGKGLVPELSPKTPLHLADLFSRCTHPDPASRPSAKMISEELGK